MQSTLIYKKLTKKEPIKIFQAKQLTLPPYHHHNVNQILYVLTGKGEIIINTIKIPINKLDLIIIKSGDKHKFSPEKKESMILYVLEFADDIFSSNIDNKMLLTFLKKLDNKKKIINTNIQGAFVIPGIMKQMLFESNHNIYEYNYMMRIKLFEILTVLKRVVFSQNDQSLHKKDDRIDKRIINSLEYIHSHYYEKLHLDVVASLSSLSKRHFARLFLKFIKMNFKEYLNKIRIEKAKQLLTNTDKEIISVCFEVGFDDLSYFYKIFKTETGITPRQFRTTNTRK